MRQTAAAFRDQTFPHLTFPHLKTLYSGALCLTQCPDQAADLVVAAYLRAYQEYEQFRGQPIPACQQARATCDWLFTNLYAAFCDGVLMHAAQAETMTGDEPCGATRLI